MKVENIAEPTEDIIFDMDGLLVDSEKLYWDASTVAAEEANLNIPDGSYLKLIGSSVKEMEEFYHQYLKTEADRDKFVKRTDELAWEWIGQGKPKLQANARDALVESKEENIKLAIASSNYDGVATHNLEVLEIKDYFGFYLGYKGVEAGEIETRPVSDIYLLTAQKTQLPKDSLLAFEDSSIGAASASAVDLKCVMVPDLKQPAILDKRNVTLIYKGFYGFLKKVKQSFRDEYQRSN